ncbi:hypothetical protein NLJ89_g6637 [Agrocybe chaxingu]|uniref:Uncharacterized protein n=1 Tax=Agrocybe chaxingu TaxID=84603 RepID=A0A9W8MW76_9AGAR|nr:hypothetical protein NLJ89_g6637 [Agrocybe chaxingu]
MASKTPLPRLGLRSRDKESQKHPGKPDQPRARRTTEEVQAEKAEKVRAQGEREEMRAQNIQWAAELETRMEVQMKDKLNTAHHPPPSTLTKVLRPRTKVPIASETANDNEIEYPEEAAVKDPVSSGSDDFYTPDKGTEVVESEDDEDILDESGEEDAGGKKLSNPHKASPFQKTGLQNGKLLQPKKSYPAASAEETKEDKQCRPPTSPPDSDVDREGGIADDAGERSERKNLSGKAVKSMLQRHYYGGSSKAGETGIHSLARIVPTTSVATFINPNASSQVAQARRKKGDIRLTHLPVRLQTDFTDKFTPRLFELFGTLNAWEQPKESDLSKLWKSVFPNEQNLNLTTSEGTVILKLVEDRLSQWRKKFGERALEALEEITFNDLPKNDSAHREWWCTWALSGSDDSCQPFYYAAYEEPDPDIEGSQLKIKGVFQSPLIAAILGIHVAWLSLIEEERRSEKKPIGALVHSIQAAKRAISWWQTGDVVKPKKPLNEYSKANWGDHVETREGRQIHIKSTSDLTTIVSKVKDKQWEKILAVARASGKRKKKAVVVVSDTQEPSQAALAELRDDDSDLADED